MPHTNSRVDGVRVTYSRTFFHAPPRENREQAITWMGTLSSAVQAATVAIHAMPEQFGESVVEDVHGQIDIAEADDSDFLGSSFPQILQQVLDLKVRLEDVTGWYNYWV